MTLEAHMPGIVFPYRTPCMHMQFAPWASPGRAMWRRTMSLFLSDLGAPGRAMSDRARNAWVDDARFAGMIRNVASACMYLVAPHARDGPNEH